MSLPILSLIAAVLALNLIFISIQVYLKSSLMSLEIDFFYSTYTHLSLKSLELWPPNKHEVDLSIEVLNIDFGQGTAKISEVKVGVRNIISRSAWFEPMQPGSAEWADIFFKLQLWPLISLQPLDKNQDLVFYFTDLFHIFLETKTQGFWTTFRYVILAQTIPIYCIK